MNSSLPSAFLDAVIQRGPNKGYSIRECIAYGRPHVVTNAADGNTIPAEEAYMQFAKQAKSNRP